MFSARVRLVCGERTKERRRLRCNLRTTSPPGRFLRQRARQSRRTGRAMLKLEIMMPGRRNSLAAQRFAVRRVREDEAPKLSAQIPALSSLRLAIQEKSGAGGTNHIRRVLVDTAPALFLVPCGDPRCTNGEHDLTRSVLHSLRAGETSFRGSDDCTGSIGSSPCLRVLHFDGTAEYHGVS
jgi:hypothetical protein